MKFPSVDYLQRQAASAFSRFYLSLIFAFAGSVAAIAMVATETEKHFLKIVTTCALGLSFSLAASLFNERRYNRRLAIVLPGVLLLLALAYYALLAPDDWSATSTRWIVFVVLAGVGHLLVAVAPFTRAGEVRSFWRFNEVLYMRFFQTAFFSAVLYAGLALALAACQALFNADIGYKAYSNLFIVITGIFNTWYFLAGFPEDYDELGKDDTFPKSLKIFTQYILIPIVMLYMAILYLYALKIMLAHDLPKGWVSSLVIWFNIVGILTVLLVYPLRNDAENKWVSTFSRMFFVASLPLTLLLYAAIFRRVHTYGITEPRYYLMLTGAWIGAISLYFIFSAGKNIKAIPVSLAVCAVLSIAGPWNVFHVSNSSQFNRLSHLLNRYHALLPNGKISVPPKTVSRADAEEIEGVVDYFVNRHTAYKLQPLLTVPIDSIMHHYSGVKLDDLYSSWTKENNFKDSLYALMYVHTRTNYEDQSSFRTFDRSLGAGIDISGFSRMFRIEYRYSEDICKFFEPGYDTVFVRLNATNDSEAINFTANGKTLESMSLSKLLDTLVHTADADQVPDSFMVATGNGILHTRFVIRSMEVSTKPGSSIQSRIRSMDGWLLVR